MSHNDGVDAIVSRHWWWPFANNTRRPKAKAAGLWNLWITAELKGIVVDNRRFENAVLPRLRASGYKGQRMSEKPNKTLSSRCDLPS